jgi:hypothetical protein
VGSEQLPHYGDPLHLNGLVQALHPLEARRGQPGYGTGTSPGSKKRLNLCRRELLAAPRHTDGAVAFPDGIFGLRRLLLASARRRNRFIGERRTGWFGHCRQANCVTLSGDVSATDQSPDPAQLGDAAAETRCLFEPSRSKSSSPGFLLRGCILALGPLRCREDPDVVTPQRQGVPLGGF